MAQEFYEVKEIRYLSAQEDFPEALRRLSQWKVQGQKTKYVIATEDSQSLANLICAKKNYIVALTVFSDESKIRAEGYQMGIEPDVANQALKRDAHRALSQRVLNEAKRIHSFEPRSRTPGLKS